jgi:glycosyltransferase involved in cell wall biosynthesis
MYRQGEMSNGQSKSREPVVPLVSVIIPTYNRAEFLSTALDSVLTQSYPNIEVVVVDDGSTDRTPEVMEHYGGRVNYRRQANGGVASARNAGLELARGELLALMDSDDICLPERIAAQVGCFAQFPEIVLCSSDFSAFNANRLIESSHIASYYSAVAGTRGGVRALYSNRDTLRRTELPWRAPESGTPIAILSGRVYEQMAWGNFIHPPTVMVRQSAVETVGGFDENIRIATEYDWLIRVCRVGPVAYLDAPLLMYRYSSEQLSAPQHSAQIYLDTITTLRKLCRDDPPLCRRHWLRLQRRIGTSYLYVANASVEQDRFFALSQLLRSMAHGVFALLTLKVVVKSCVPRIILRYYRGLRKPHQNTPASHAP